MNTLKTFKAPASIEGSIDLSDLGKLWCEATLPILFTRDPKNDQLRSLGFEKKLQEKLMQRGLEFQKSHNHGVFEKDNLSHVGRLMAAMKRYAKPLENFLGISYLDAQLLAALHDMGKARAPEAMHLFLSGIFGKDDFISLRVLPHELYSMFWIEQLGREMKLDSAAVYMLMDQIACHNFGPKISDPENSKLWSRRNDGATRHWWVERWKSWAAKMSSAGVKVPSEYGYTISPLADTLVLFDRVDGGNPHAWEKYLNQDLISGKLVFSAERIIEMLDDSNAAAKEQVVAVGRQLHAAFVEAKAKAPIEDFEPYSDALKMVELSREVLERLRESNSAEWRGRFPNVGQNAILYRDLTDRWFCIEGRTGMGLLATRYEWTDNRWQSVETSENPVVLLVETIYSDWRGL